MAHYLQDGAKWKEQLQRQSLKIKKIINVAYKTYYKFSVLIDQ
jgi:hypothetical protein